MKGMIYSVCISKAKGTRKKEVHDALLIPDRGIKGDAHAGPGRRQVSLLPIESINGMIKWIPSLKPGDFAENITTRGIDLSVIRVGDNLEVGERILLEVTQIGKECHSGCEIQRAAGKCIMPEQGIFARVVVGGLVMKGQEIRVKKGTIEKGNRQVKAVTYSQA